ncbi:MAG: hypothetical protein NTY15_16140 [Planctomycetota bacterium]|nr:hypothetical protein [Planctomycetota bacterium]
MPLSHVPQPSFYFNATRLLAFAVFGFLSFVGCSLGPRTLMHSRLRYNDAVKTTSEEQLLLNIIRLRYTDTPSSLAISSIADQQEVVAGLGIVPFFTSAGAGDIGSYRGSILPQAQLSGTARPTLSYTPQDDEEFTRRLFSPISLEGAAYLSRTTWPISTVFRLYLENLNWVSNAETASGPTPLCPPEYETFLQGVQALQRLHDKNLITLFSEDREKAVSSTFALSENNAKNALESIHNDVELKVSAGGVTLIRQEKQIVMRVNPNVESDSDWFVFCNAFKLNPSFRTFDLTSGKLDPFLKDMPATGLESLDLETRSLLQVLFFISQGVEVPQEHLASGVAPRTNGDGGEPFDWQQVLGGLFRVRCVQSKKRPSCAHIAVQYKGYWYYIDERDRDSKSTFALLIEVSRLELESTKSKAPLLTLPLGR